MALFIVLWLLNTSKAVKEAVAGDFKDPAGTANKVGSNIAGSGEKILVSHDNMSQLMEKLEMAIKQMPNFEKVKKHTGDDHHERRAGYRADGIDQWHFF